MRRSAALALGVLACGRLAAADEPGVRLERAAFAEPALSALILEREVSEISGIALSRRTDDLLWAVNDSDHGAMLYGLDVRGNVVARVEVQGVVNVDWEDLAAFTLDGRDWLLIGDTGDNGGLRRELNLIVVEEPVLEDGRRDATEVTPAWTIRVRWPDGPRDCEAVAVDATRREALLLSKKRVPAQLFRVALGRPSSASEVRVAEQIAEAQGLPQPTAGQLERDFAYWRWRTQVTAMDVDPAGRRLVVLTYLDGYLYERSESESWRDALRRSPKRLGLPPLPQGEAIAFDRHGRAIWATSEKLPAPLIRLDPR